MVLIGIGAVSCGDALTEQNTQTFTQPQPVNTKTLLQFPNKLQGKYLSLNDSSFIKIGNNFILRIYEGWGNIDNVNFNSSFVWKGDSVIEKGKEQKYQAMRLKDSIAVHFYVHDTLIVLNASTALLKKLKQNYFLNLQGYNGNWTVKMLSAVKDKLFLNDVADSTQVVNNAPDTTPAGNSQLQPLNLSKQEFKRYVRESNFQSKEIFVKVVE